MAHQMLLGGMPVDGTVYAEKSVSPQSHPESDHFFESAHKNQSNLEKHLCGRASLKNPKLSTRNTSLSLNSPLDGVSRKAQSTLANADRTHCTRFDSAGQYVFFAVRLKL